MGHFYKPSSVSMEMRQHPPELFCRSQRPHTRRSGARCLGGDGLGLGPRAPSPSSSHCLTCPPPLLFCFYNVFCSLLLNSLYLILPPWPAPTCATTHRRPSPFQPRWSKWLEVFLVFSLGGVCKPRLWAIPGRPRASVNAVFLGHSQAVYVCSV